MQSQPVRRLNATLPEPLAQHVAQMTGEHGLYETPSEFVRDLIRRHMETIDKRQQHEINAMLETALRENEYSLYHPQNAEDIRASLRQSR